MSDGRLKLLYIIKTLYQYTDDNNGITSNELIEHLSKYGIRVERKTLYKDLDLLRDFGIDIIKEKVGRGVKYHIGNRFFELPELKLLVDSVLASRFITENKSKQLIHKLESLTSINEARELDRHVVVTGRVKSGNESIYYIVDSIHLAIINDVKVRFQYYEWYGNKKKRFRRNGEYYSVSPQTLLWHNQNYYLIGFDDKYKDIRYYRVDKISNVKITDIAREGMEEFKSFDLSLFSKMIFGMYAGEERNVLIRVDKEFAGVIYDRFGLDIPVQEYDEDKLDIEVTVYVSEQFLGWILSLGDKVKIVSPDDVVDKIRNMINNRKELYEIK